MISQSNLHMGFWLSHVKFMPLPKTQPLPLPLVIAYCIHHTLWTEKNPFSYERWVREAEETFPIYPLGVCSCLSCETSHVKNKADVTALQRGMGCVCHYQTQRGCQRTLRLRKSISSINIVEAQGTSLESFCCLTRHHRFKCSIQEWLFWIARYTVAILWLS